MNQFFHFFNFLYMLLARQILFWVILCTLVIGCKNSLASYERKAVSPDMLSQIAVDQATSNPGQRTSALATSVLYMVDGPFQLNVPNADEGFSLRDSMALYKVRHWWTPDSKSDYWVFSEFGKTNGDLVSIYSTDLPSVKSGEIFPCMIDYLFCPPYQRAYIPQAAVKSDGGGKQP